MHLLPDQQKVLVKWLFTLRARYTNFAMTYNCPQCGSKRVHQSRFRPGERTASNLFLAPFRCRDCKARFWERNTSAYFVAAISAGGILLFGTFVWLALSPDEISSARLSSQSPAGVTETAQDAISAAANGPSSNPILSAAVERGQEIDKQALNEKPGLPDPSDNRFYTVSLFLEKANKGNPDAQYQLGLLYLAGRGTLQDFSEAAKWFIMAAEQNHPFAQYELGLLYQVGQGVDMDLEKSYMWFNLAAAAGVEQAMLARDKAMRSLSSKQLTAAQKAAREWLESRK